MMEESLEAILALFRSDEPVTRETDWFTIREGRLQYRPYTDPHPEVAVAAMVTPSGPRLAGQYGVSLLSLSMSVAEGFAAIGQAWDVVEEQAAKSGHTLDRSQTGGCSAPCTWPRPRSRPSRTAPTGCDDFANYFGGGAGFVPLANTVTESSSDSRQYVEAYAASGNVVIGTPDDAIAYIEDLIEQSGGFGTFLLLGHDWADADATMRSNRLFAREVIPHFRHQLAAPRVSHEWAIEKRDELFGRAGQAMLNAITAHVEEQGRTADAAAADAVRGGP